MRIQQQQVGKRMIEHMITQARAIGWHWQCSVCGVAAIDGPGPGGLLTSRAAFWSSYEATSRRLGHSRRLPVPETSLLAHHS
jgi:hypothetical protein